MPSHWSSSYQRPAADVTDAVKNTTMIFDVHMKVAEYGGLARLVELIQQGQLENLPPPLCVQERLPVCAKMGAIIHNLQDGTMNIIKTFPTRWACLMPRSSPQVMSLCLFTNQIRVHTPSERPSNSYCNGCLAFEFCGIMFRKWAPEDEGLRRGIDGIDFNDNAPEGDARNEQTFWILSNIQYPGRLWHSCKWMA